MTDTIRAPQKRPPIWRDATVLKWAAQIGVLAGVVALFWILGSQAAANFEAQGREFSWRFLTDNPGIQIGEGIFTQPESGLEAIATGIVNMFRITFSGIIAATLLGVIVGVSRLSSNWLLNRTATVYVELFRNVPTLLWIVVFFIIASRVFPDLADDEATRWLIVSNKGVSIPWFFPTATFWQWFTIVAIGFVVARIVFRNRLRLLEETGRDTFPGRYAVATFLGFAVLGWFLHPVMGAIGWLWQLLLAIVEALPTIVWQIVIAAVIAYLAVRWIRRFLDSFRSPAGMAKLTDDDWFRVGLAGLIGLAGALVFLFIPSITTLITDVTAFVFDFLDQKFDFLRTGAPMEFRRPEIVVPGRFSQIGPSGMTMTPAFFGVWVGLTLYTASYIAEIVRGGILAVSKGQTEAGLALGLTRAQLLRMIVLPQAFRIVLPPLGNQYLNLAKNTSLGIAVGFAEIVAVQSTISNQTGQWLQGVLIWMAFYLSVSLVLSGIVNRYNRKLKLVER